MNADDCRACGATLKTPFCDLGMQPLANHLIAPQDLDRGEITYPLRPRICEDCFLVQLAPYGSPETLFGDYAYFSSYSDTWLRHVAAYTGMIVQSLRLGADSHVIEIASNDGHLLQEFMRRGIPVLGIEPARNVAAVAEQAGVPTLPRFFGSALAQELADAGKQADLIVANNVLAHVPDLHDFVAGLALLLRKGGTATLEFPHLLRLMQGTQYDSIYHEHFSYLTLQVVERVFGQHALEIFDAEELSTHGGSLRLYARHRAGVATPASDAVARLRALEHTAGMDRLDTYGRFQADVLQSKVRLLELVLDSYRSGESLAGYGAPAKASTLLNYCGIGPDLISYTVDRSPHKQGRLIPGVRLPILPPEQLRATRPSRILIFAWNLADEIAQQLDYVRAWGARLVVPIPRAKLLP